MTSPDSPSSAAPADSPATAADHAPATVAGVPVPTTDVPANATLDDIYRALQRGAGRELVDDHNVDALIERAQQHGDVQLEYLLREWRSPCGDDPAAPDLEQIQGNPPPREGPR